MRHRALQFVGLLLIAATLAACDKCADNFLVDPFAAPKPHSCKEGPPPR